MQTFYQIATNFGLWRSETNANFSGEHPLDPLLYYVPQSNSTPTAVSLQSTAKK